jgi:hypothetical protein
MQVSRLPQPIESLRISIQEIGHGTGVIEIAWGDTAVSAQFAVK